MALEHAILVALSERPATGYDLAQRFQRSIGFFWAASHQQIYRVLRRMEGDGWVSSTQVVQHGRPNKQVYEPTGRGRGELVSWLATPTEPEPLRSDIAVKVRAAHGEARAAVLDDVRRHRDQHAKRLSLYEQFEAADYPDPKQVSDDRLPAYLVLRGGIRSERSWIGWCDEVIDALEKSLQNKENDR